MSQQLQQISVDELHPAEWNRDLGDLTDLTTDIKERGVLQTLLVRPNGSGFTIVAGERRWTAAKLAGLTEVPCIVDELDAQAALEAQLVENLLRKDIEPLEEAEGYRRLRDMGVPQNAIADKVKRSQAHVSKRLALLELPETA